MPRKYSSFLLRVWQLDDEWRIQVEHIQSGNHVRLDSLDQVIAWIGAQPCDSSAGGCALAAPSEEKLA